MTVAKVGIKNCALSLKAVHNWCQQVWAAGLDPNCQCKVKCDSALGIDKTINAEFQAIAFCCSVSVMKSFEQSRIDAHVRLSNCRLSRLAACIFPVPTTARSMAAMASWPMLRTNSSAARSRR